MKKLHVLALCMFISLHSSLVLASEFLQINTNVDYDSDTGELTEQQERLMKTVIAQINSGVVDHEINEIIVPKISPEPNIAYNRFSPVKCKKPATACTQVMGFAHLGHQIHKQKNNENTKLPSVKVKSAVVLPAEKKIKPSRPLVRQVKKYSFSPYAKSI